MTSERGVISYPIPIYQNVPIHAEYYQPHRFVISAITLAQQTIITTSIAHDYVIGQEVRLIIPQPFGTRGLNGKSAIVLAIPSTTQVTLNISSIGMDAFIAYTPVNPYIPSGGATVAQILAIGDVNSGQINANGRIMQSTYILGSFINISPL